jgi:hypothetical protein
MKWIAEPDGLCLYLEVTDEQLARIRSDAFYYRDEVFLQELENTKGENCHVVGIYGNGVFSKILYHHRELLKKYKSVTWWNKNKNKFKERSTTCLQSS